MTNPFYERPILNSPYEYPERHWELDEFGQPTGAIVDKRRRVSLITPVPKPKKQRADAKQRELLLDEGRGLSTTDQQYELTSRINEVRQLVDTWRNLPVSQWQVTPETARLLQHWRHHQFSDTPSGQNTRTPRGSAVYTFPGSTTSKIGKPHEYFDLTPMRLATTPSPCTSGARESPRRDDVTQPSTST